MLRNIGKIGHISLLLADGYDRYRGIIGREAILESSVLIFPRCMQIHSFFVRARFSYCVISAKEHTIVYRGTLDPWQISPLFSVNSHFCEYSEENSQDILNVVTYLNDY